jgi:hypothetical protein
LLCRCPQTRLFSFAWFFILWDIRCLNS